MIFKPWCEQRKNSDFHSWKNCLLLIKLLHRHKQIILRHGSEISTGSHEEERAYKLSFIFRGNLSKSSTQVWSRDVKFILIFHVVTAPHSWEEKRKESVLQEGNPNTRPSYLQSSTLPIELLSLLAKAWNFWVFEPEFELNSEYFTNHDVKLPINQCSCITL